MIPIKARHEKPRHAKIKKRAIREKRDISEEPKKAEEAEKAQAPEKEEKSEKAENTEKKAEKSERPKKQAAAAESSGQPARWKRLLLTATVLAILIATMARLLWENIRYNRTHYTAEFYQIHSRKLTRSFRIVFLTDVHLREYGADNCNLVQDIRNLKPDLILLGGDMATYDVGPSYDNMLSLCSQLAGIAPVCGVLGNHEDELYFLDGDTDLVDRFTEAGVRVLRNQETVYLINDNTISILGIEGNSRDFDKYGAREFMDRAEQKTNYDFRICIAHVPTYFPDALENYSFELGLAGHTHGGIIRLPMIGPLYSAEEGFFPTYGGGSYAMANGGTLIVSRGLGDSSAVPRINNVPELSVIDID